MHNDPSVDRFVIRWVYANGFRICARWLLFPLNKPIMQVSQSHIRKSSQMTMKIWIKLQKCIICDVGPAYHLLHQIRQCPSQNCKLNSGGVEISQICKRIHKVGKFIRGEYDKMYIISAGVLKNVIVKQHWICQIECWCLSLTSGA